MYLWIVTVTFKITLQTQKFVTRNNLTLLDVAINVTFFLHLLLLLIRNIFEFDMFFIGRVIWEAPKKRKIWEVHILCVDLVPQLAQVHCNGGLCWKMRCVLPHVKNTHMYLGTYTSTFACFYIFRNKNSKLVEHMLP